jgi:uncharacterized protein YbjQ (UPF0145 family)
MNTAAVRFYTIESVPVREYLGAVTFWARDADLGVAEERALAGLAERAAAMGGDMVVGLRVETDQELVIMSEPRALGSQVLVASEGTYRVYVTGTSARS